MCWSKGHMVWVNGVVPRQCLSRSWEGELAGKGLCKVAVLMLAHRTTHTRGKDGKHRTGRERTKPGKSNALLTHPSSTPLGRKALLKLQSTHLPESLNSPSWPSLHKQELGVPPAQAAISKDCRKGHKGQTEEQAAEAKSRGHQGTPRAGSGQGQASQACSPTETDFKQSVGS